MTHNKTQDVDAIICSHNMWMQLLVSVYEVQPWFVFLCVSFLNECAQVGETHYGDRLVFNDFLNDEEVASILKKPFLFTQIGHLIEE